MPRETGLGRPTPAEVDNPPPGHVSGAVVGGMEGDEEERFLEEALRHGQLGYTVYVGGFQTSSACYQI